MCMAIRGVKGNTAPCQAAMNNLSLVARRCAQLAGYALAIMVLVADRAVAQPLPLAELEPRVGAAVDRLYPGFREVLESKDSEALARLARTLAANPSAESLSVLLWMLQYCPSWGTSGSSAVSRSAVSRERLASFRSRRLRERC